jgi:hypothetical protein
VATSICGHPFVGKLDIHLWTAIKARARGKNGCPQSSKMGVHNPSHNPSHNPFHNPSCQSRSSSYPAFPLPSSAEGSNLQRRRRMKRVTSTWLAGTKTTSRDGMSSKRGPTAVQGASGCATWLQRTLNSQKQASHGVGSDEKGSGASFPLWILKVRVPEPEISPVIGNPKVSIHGSKETSAAFPSHTFEWARIL